MLAIAVSTASCAFCTECGGPCPGSGAVPIERPELAGTQPGEDATGALQIEMVTGVPGECWHKHTLWLALDGTLRTPAGLTLDTTKVKLTSSTAKSRTYTHEGRTIVLTRPSTVSVDVEVQDPLGGTFARTCTTLDGVSLRCQ